MTVGELRAVIAAIGVEPAPSEIADILWYTLLTRDHQRARQSSGLPQSQVPPIADDAEICPPPAGTSVSQPGTATISQADKLDSFELRMPDPIGSVEGHRSSRVLVHTTTRPALRDPLSLTRALRPLRRRQEGDSTTKIDERATADLAAEQRLWLPVLAPTDRLSLDLTLIIDASTSMILWDRLARELGTICQQLGAFSDIRTWYLVGGPHDALLGPAIRGASRSSSLRDPRGVHDPSGRRLILVVTDGVHPWWLPSGPFRRVLADWSKSSPIAIVQPFPQRLWDRSSLRPVLTEFRPAGSGRHATQVARPPGPREETVVVPVLELTPEALRRWARLIAGLGPTTRLAGAIVTGERRTALPQLRHELNQMRSNVADPHGQIRAFRASASPAAYQLASYLSVVAPLNLPVMRLVQESTMPEAGSAELAEVFLGGLLVRLLGDTAPSPDSVTYGFPAGVREILQSNITRAQAVTLIDQVGSYLVRGARTGRPLPAILDDPSGGDMTIASEMYPPFARIASNVLLRLGGSFAQVSTQITVGQITAETNLSQLESWDEGGTRIARNLKSESARIDHSLTASSENRLSHDVFLSFTRTGHPELARDVKAALNKRGISVFMDEDIPAGENIVSKITEALNESRIMVVVYSASYNRHPACQRELIRAYLIGAAEGFGPRRILVINPEADDKHIFPADIADLKYLRPDQLDVLVDSVKRKLAVVTEPMGTVKLADQASRPSWLSPDVAGAFGFTGRFGELWTLHNALSITDRPLTAAAYAPPVAVITGMPGIGKTYLARAYGWLFYALYPGGVHYVSVNGSAGASRARDRFADAIRKVAIRHGIVTASQRTEQVIGLIADHVSATAKPELWIVDDLPADLDAATLAQFVIPASPIRTILIAPTCPGGVQEVNLTGLNEIDGLAVLKSGRPIGKADQLAAESIVRRLGGHPLALATAAGYLRGLDGLVSYSDYDASLATAGPDPDILASIGRSMGDLKNSERTTIALAGVLGGAVPNVLISDVLAAIGPSSASPEQAATQVIGRLRHGGFAVVESAALRIHPLVIQASALLGPPVVPLAQIATIAARKLTSLLADEPDDQDLIRIALILAQHEALKDTQSALRLVRHVAALAQSNGNIAQAAACWHWVTSSRLSTEADAVSAALACVANAEFERGVGHARHALGTGLAGDPEVQARWALAAGLDGLAFFDEADDLWAWLASATWTPAPTQRVAFEIARAKAMVARGRLADARAILERVLTVSAPALVDADQLNAARIEFARLQIWTGKERDGRVLAESVVSYYRGQNTPGHALCMTAEMIWAEATFALGLFELPPDKSNWTEARELLDQMTKDHPLMRGPDSQQGTAVSATVLLGLVLVWLGEPGKCVETLLPVLPLLEQRLGPGHPLPLRARYALSLAYCQLGDWGAGADILAEVFPAQRQLIGPRHPDTLRSQLQYGIALKFANGKQDELSAKMINEVWSTMPKEVGRLSDLNAQLIFARGLRRTPYPMLRGLLTMSKWLERGNRQ